MQDNLEYRAYLDSPQWRSKRARILASRGHRCEVCQHGHKLSLHHRTYARLYDELDADLLVVCESCHAALHNRWQVVGAIGAKQHKQYIKNCLERFQNSPRPPYRSEPPDEQERQPWVWGDKPREHKKKTRRRPQHS